LLRRSTRPATGNRNRLLLLGSESILEVAEALTEAGNVPVNVVNSMLVDKAVAVELEFADAVEHGSGGTESGDDAGEALHLPAYAKGLLRGGPHAKHLGGDFAEEDAALQSQAPECTRVCALSPRDLLVAAKGEAVDKGDILPVDVVGEIRVERSR